MMVLDSSAVLAWLLNEPGAAQVDEALSESCISTVNWSEVLQKTQPYQPSIQITTEKFSALGLQIIPLNIEQAEQAALLHPITQPAGLSLGDRTCLALAKSRDFPVLTADRAWQKVDIGVEIILIRNAQS